MASSILYTTALLVISTFFSSQGIQAAVLASRNSSCRCLPGDPCWPGPADWAKLNDTINGRLIATVPLGAPCHDPMYNGQECSELKAIWTVPQSYFNSSSTMMSPIFQNESCVPFAPESSSCDLGNYPVFSIDIKTPSDVSTGLKFAQEKNLRVSIKNTGHDYLGKNSGQGSLGMWTHNLKSIKFFNYTSNKYTGPVIKMGAGVQAWEAYEAADKAGLHVVGGDCPTVGLAGGYSQGAGHGPLASTYGLGADQVLEWEVVTAQGQHLTASATKNPDLYWALTGGGGGTYAVVVSMTARAYQDDRTGGASLIVQADGVTQDTYWDMIALWQTGLPSFVDQNVGVVSFFTNKTFTVAPLTKMGASKEDMDTLLSNYTSQLSQHNVKYNLTTSSTPNYLGHVAKYLGPLPYGNYDSSQMVGSRLIPRSVVERNNTALMTALRHISNAGYEVDILANNVSHATARNDPSTNAVNPAWRNSLMHIVVAGYWDWNLTREENLAVSGRITTEIVPLLEDLTPDSGTYLNEADYQLKTWKWDFFGENYERLLAVKDKYDPEHLLYATKAVGSDSWTVASDGRLCRA